MSNHDSNFWHEIQKELANDEKAKETVNMSNPGNVTSDDAPFTQSYKFPFDNTNVQTPAFPDIFDAPTGNPPPSQVLSDQDNILSILKNNIGYYVVCEFLIGTTGLETKEGILFSSGVNFLTLYHPSERTYTVCDIYSVKFITFYNSRVVPPERMTAKGLSARNSSVSRSSRRFY